MRIQTRFFVVMAFAAVGTSSASAQRLPPPTGPGYEPSTIYQSLVAINPLSIPFNIGSVEAETSLSGGATLGASASYSDLGASTGRFSTVEGKFRYYAGDIPFRGIAVGVGLGLTRFSKDVEDGFGNETRQTLDAPTIGMLLDYDWSPGPSHRFVVGLGVEAKRILASDQDRNQADLPQAYPAFRFVIGLAF